VTAIAPSSGAFIAGRAVTGIGAGALLQGAFGILTYVCTLEMRPLFLGIVVSMFGLFSSVGPLIGGVLTERVSWRWCFWMYVSPLPRYVFSVAIICLVLTIIEEIFL
jgi:MFS family permease